MLFQFLPFLTVLATLAACSLNAQQPATPSTSADWVRVERIQPKRRIIVKLSSGQILRGTFVDADAEGVRLLRGGNQTVKISREEILLIRKGSRGGTGALIGLAAGAGSMMILTASSPGDLSRGAAAGLGAIVGGGIGAALGALIGAVARPASTIYEATSSTPSEYKVTLAYDYQRAVKSGTSIEIRVQLSAANGENISSRGVVLHALSVSSDTGPGTSPVQAADDQNPGNNFRYDPGWGVRLPGYSFNLSTNGLEPGSYNLNFQVGRATTTEAAPFHVM